MKIVLCASVTSYKHVVQVQKLLEQNEYSVIIPHTAALMAKDNDFDYEHYVKKYYSGRTDYKQTAIKKHFHEIALSDAILVVNDKKNGRDGYIGPNVLMELAVGFYLKKKLFLLYPKDTESPFRDELNALDVFVLDGDVQNIANYV